MRQTRMMWIRRWPRVAHEEGNGGKSTSFGIPSSFHELIAQLDFEMRYRRIELADI
jgi:hypothetical protein